MSISDRLIEAWLPFLLKDNISADETRQRLFVAVATFFAAPALVFLVILEALNAQWLMTYLLAIGVALLVFGYLAARTESYRAWMPKAIFAYMLILIFSQIMHDRGQFTLYYLFIVPIISVFVFGRSEGLLWSLVVFGVTAPLTLFPSVFGVPSLSGAWADFIGTYIIIVGFSAGYETLRARAFYQFEMRNRELEIEHNRVVEVQKRLEEREARFRAFTELSSDWVLEFDTDYVIEYASKDITERLDAVGLSVEEMLQTFGADSGLLERVQRGEELNGELLAVPQPSGRMAYYVVSAKAQFSEDGKLLGYIAGGKDVTDTEEKERDLKIKEQALFHTQKLEALGQLTSGVTHDFNNLLTVISGNLELLEESAIAGGEEESLQAGFRAVDRAAELTGQLLSFARKQNLEPKTVDVVALFSTMTDMLKRTLGDAIEVKQEIDPGLWTCVADPAQLESAMLNLAINARDAMSGHGDLYFRAENFVHDGEGQLALTPGEYVSIAVQDTGCGIEPEHIERILEPFFTTKPMGEGTGLGLSMIYGFVTQSGGAIDVKSQINEGSTFTLYLPRAIKKAALEGAVDDKDRGPALTILVVEDDDGVQRILERVLKRDHHEVAMFNSGEDAIEALHVTNPDVVITDLMLGSGMNGLQFAEQVRKNSPGMPLLLMSGNPESLMSSSEFETYALLKKPFSSQDLLSSIRSVVKAAS